ncbi:ankyrin repeat domain-containing protein [Sulfurimonas sp. HSL-1716]|uniref:ankyrin repeat domain-containing protein n=1 Tax=Hydrocurvibacter sulfurireducens TaxID=3131937 RepID=UPI0031F9B166
MPFMQRLQSAMILKTSLHQMYETNIVEHPEKKIYKAIEQNDVQKIQQMIYNGYDVDLKSSHHIPALIYATIHNRVDCINLFLQNGANVNISDKDGRTALHFAVNLCLYELVYLLLKYGASPDQKDEKSRSALDYALNYKDKKSIKLLQTTEQIPVHSSNLLTCVKNANLYDLSRNLKHRNVLFEKNSIGQSLLHAAVLSGDIKMMNYLCNKGLNIDERDINQNTPLIYAILNSTSLHTVEFLCKKGAEIDIKNRHGQSPLLVSIKYGFDEIADYLIETGANVNIVENVNTSLTLCHFAIYTYRDKADKFREIQTKLIAKGATVDMSINKLGWTPLMHCCIQKETSMIKDHFEILIQLGANLNKTDINGRTPLMLATSVGNSHFLQRIIENYADIDRTDNFGWSALIFAVYYSQRDVVKGLLVAGANSNIVTNNGQSALQIATQQQNLDLVNLLKDYGAYEHNK